MEQAYPLREQKQFNTTALVIKRRNVGVRVLRLTLGSERPSLRAACEIKRCACVGWLQLPYSNTTATSRNVLGVNIELSLFSAYVIWKESLARWILFKQGWTKAKSALISSKETTMSKLHVSTPHALSFPWPLTAPIPYFNLGRRHCCASQRNCILCERETERREMLDHMLKHIMILHWKHGLNV